MTDLPEFFAPKPVPGIFTHPPMRAYGRIERLRSFWQRPKYALRCDVHGDLGRFDTVEGAENYWHVHDSVARHGCTCAVSPNTGKRYYDDQCPAHAA